MFGFGAGDIQIELDQTHYKLGESVTGVFILNLKKPLKATRLLATVRVKQHTHRDSMGMNAQVEKETTLILEIPVEVDGEREYGASGEAERFSFSVPLPEERPGQEVIDQLPEMARTALAAAIRLQMGGATSFTSFVEARLDIPWALDLTADAEIHIDLGEVEF